MRFNTLHDWLSWQESLNPKEIDLGLDRVASVLQQTGYSARFPCPLITVAGTNGKGSVIAMLEAIALAAGLNVCSYTSPHLLHYNERIRINGNNIDDESLCHAFERLDQARGETALTYFEFGTLAAIDIFMRAEPDLVLMEVGLGGRLDAVNIMDPDVAVVTTVDIDHTDWLGDDREAIGFEKAGIFRPDKPAICGDPEPPVTLTRHVDEIGADGHYIGQAFKVVPGQDSWSLRIGDEFLHELPFPALIGDFQLNNAAAAIMAIRSIPGLDVSTEVIRKALTQVQLRGRFETVNEHPRVIVDVAHNPQAMRSLVMQLRNQPCSGKTIAVIAMLKDKPVREVIELLRPEIDQWYVAGLEPLPRAMSVEDLAAIVDQQAADVKLTSASTVGEACKLAVDAAGLDDRIIICGSFHTVADAMSCFAVG
jgi:dihydrofolate synthase/folylpolyglutamate synthase